MFFRLTPPSQLTVLASVVLALVAVARVVGYADVPHWGFGLLLVAYLVLLAGILFQGA
jgi:hypothetical protein